MDQKSLVDLLGRTPLFGALDEAERTAVAARMRRVQFTPDQMIFSRGDPGREIYLVLEGRIRLSVLSSEGRELSFDLAASPGHVFGEIAALDGGERTASATAVSHVQAMVLPREVMLEFIERNPKLAMATIHLLCQRLRQTDQRLEAIALYRIEVRLARLMLSFLKMQPEAPKGGKAKLELGMSQSELGLLVGASRPKVNQALTMLEEMGAIEKSGSGYICDVEELKSVADTE
jgi:CRP-like cAMP-binding protein